MRRAYFAFGKIAAMAVAVGVLSITSSGPTQAGILGWWFQQKQNAINGVTGQRPRQNCGPSPADMRRACDQMLRQAPAPRRSGIIA